MEPPSPVSRRVDRASTARVRDRIRRRRTIIPPATAAAMTARIKIGQAIKDRPLGAGGPRAGIGAGGAASGSAWGRGSICVVTVGASGTGAGAGDAATGGGSGTIRERGEGAAVRGGALDAPGSGFDAGTAVAGVSSTVGDIAGVAITASIGVAGTGSTGAMPALSAGADVSAGAEGFAGGLRTALINPLTRLPTSTPTPASELVPELEGEGWLLGGVPAGASDWAKADVVASEAIAKPTSSRICPSPSPITCLFVAAVKQPSHAPKGF
jgi:hypothetical protein